MQATLEQVKQVQVLKNLAVSDLEQIQLHAKVVSYQPGEIVIHEGDRLPPQLYALIEGRLQVSKTAATGKETILRSIPSGEIFAAPAAFGSPIAPATVMAQSDCQVLTVPRDVLLETIRQNPEVALRILEVFNRRLQQLHNTVHGLISERAIVRLVRLIQYHASQSGTEWCEEGERLKIKLTHYQMARSIGITYEECVRLIKSLPEILVYRRGGTIVILDPEALEAIALSSVRTDV